VTTLTHRLLLAASALGGIAFPLLRGARPAAAQGALLVCAAALGAVAFAGASPSFWPLAVWAATVPWLRTPGHPPTPVALKLPLALLATTIGTHAVFFGEDRYHMVVAPVLAILAAAALRRPTAAT
jgi:hypothetical protein